jgi:hypothetical protein
LTGWQFEIGRSTANDGIYTLASAPTYSTSTKKTTFTVTGTVPSSTGDGYFRSHYPAPQDVSNSTVVSFPATFASQLTLGSPPGSQTPGYNFGPRLTNIYSPDRYVPQESLVLAKRFATSAICTWAA